ncbi:helix-turn-helix domain-containing protein [Ekhidna sp.]|uniref:helix-turn-helix domain-containing protein n=1 Tax=Ekhidna sp. TaxID=2608089 RepID=UPI003298F0BB
METLKYKVIKTRKQYDEYCDILNVLVFDENRSDETEDEIELLTLLIEKYDKENSSIAEVEPIQLLKSLMKDHKLKSKDLVEILGVSKGLVSDILNYKKGLSKEVIRKLADRFKLSQEAFNRPYKLKISTSPKMRNASMMNTQKKLETA